MGIFITWLVFSLVVGYIGGDRKIGFFGAFFLSLLLSPIIGLIITLLSKDEAEEARKAKMLQLQEEQHKTLSKISAAEKNNTTSVADELLKLQKLKENGIVSEEEFEKLRRKVIG